MESSEAGIYNYPRFVEGADFAGFRGVLSVASAAPDFTAIDLATGHPVPLSSFWQERDLMAEFGSVT